MPIPISRIPTSLGCLNRELGLGEKLLQSMLLILRQRVSTMGLKAKARLEIYTQ
jgi:hypothetical protein